MKKRFQISRDSSRKLLEFKMWGFWTKDEYKTFEKEFQNSTENSLKYGSKKLYFTYQIIYTCRNKIESK